VDGQSVLVPVVYLAQASQQNMNGPLIAATNIDLQNAQSFTNGNTSGKNTGGAAPMLGQNDSSSDSATTKSGVSAGTVTITDS
ncbi:hypothetical protein, partial [Burkholderia gladioli]|uniref:hypothetical protein n=1 Tax=Burkholderia gladioli TaxID=28095 RepID=UPI00163DF3AF